MKILLPFVVGVIFGLGLILSGMSNPAKVHGFLDLAGSWDPSLALVMAGAITPASIAFSLTRRWNSSLFGDRPQLPTATRVDPRLVIGSALFGVGWGLAGICPGPALVLLGSGSLKGFVFVLAMLAGMAVFEMFSRQQANQAE